MSSADAPPPLASPTLAPPTLAPYWPDLLCARPHVSLDRGRAEQLIHEAFTTGDSERCVSRVMDHQDCGISHWHASEFEAALGVDEFLETSIPPELTPDERRFNLVYLRRLVTRPPQCTEDRDHRRAIQAELRQQPNLRAALFASHRRLIKIRTELEAIDTVGYFDSSVRRLYILRLLLEYYTSAMEAFAEAQSGLVRLARYAEFVASTSAFDRLRELMDYEQRMAEVEFVMRLGADGRMRHFEIRGRRENKANRYHQNPFRRGLARFSMWLLGYQIGDAGLASSWIEEVFAQLRPYLPALLQILAEQEFHLLGLGFQDRCDRAARPISFPEIDTHPDDGPQFMLGLFNPLLLRADTSPIPCDLPHGISGQVILTGPNSGGKTRLLQAIAWAQLLGESGLYAPVASARLHRAHGLFITLIEGSIASHSEGRLGTELQRVRRLFELAQPGVLVLLDELCSGTDPSEAEDIFALVLELLDQLGARSVVATHFLDFVRRLAHEATPGRGYLRVASEDGQSASYQFTEGIAPSSMALRVAARLGVTRNDLRALVASRLRAAQ